jgi:hypothetical protein
VVRSTDVVKVVLADRGITVGTRTAENIVQALLRPECLAQDSVAEVRGRGSDGEPTTVILRACELRDAIRRAGTEP